MKKSNLRFHSIALCVLLAAMAFTGCAVTGIEEVPYHPPEPPPEPPAASPPALEEIPEPPPTNPVVGVTAANVQVHYVDDGLFSHFEEWNIPMVALDQLGSYHEFVEFDEVDHPRIVVTTGETVQHFHFVELQWEFEGDESFVWATILYSLDELRPAQPFVVTWMEWGTFPHRGISFEDEDGMIWIFAIQSSGYDGTLFLVDLEEIAILRSPRTAVTGILEDPEQDWTSISVTAWLEPDQWPGEGGAEGTTHTLSTEDAASAFEILSTMAATEVLTPFHMESQQSDPMFRLEITFADGSTETIHTTEAGIWFFRFTDTYGVHNDPGYVFGESEALFEILMAYF